MHQAGYLRQNTMVNAMETPKDTAQEVLLARQPIYDRNLTIQAYELLFRSDTQNRAQIFNGDQASCEVLLNTYSAISLESITGNCPAFVNMSRTMLVDPSQLPFPKDQIVFEILENVPIDDYVVNWTKEARKLGFKIALDDFIYERQYDPILPLVDYVKIDLLALPMDEVERHVQLLKPYPAKLLAEKVETLEVHQQCMDLGFELFQGYFLSKPKIVTGQKVKTGTQVALQILQELQNPDCSPDSIQKLLSQDAALTYKLLRIVNSASFGLPRKIESIRQAIMMLGLKPLRSWLNLVALSSSNQNPPALLQILLFRAHMCESLAKLRGQNDAHIYFTVGLFSGLDALLGMTMATALSQLTLSQDLNEALLTRQGKLGTVLNQVIAYERGNWRELNLDANNHHLLAKAYMDSINWADKVAADIR